MVMTSAAKIPNLWAAVGYLAGAIVRYATARSVQTAVNIRKFIWEGDHHQAQLEEEYARTPSTIAAKSAWTILIGSMNAAKARPMMREVVGVKIWDRVFCC